MSFFPTPATVDSTLDDLRREFHIKGWHDILFGEYVMPIRVKLPVAIGLQEILRCISLQEARARLIAAIKHRTGGASVHREGSNRMTIEDVRAVIREVCRQDTEDILERVQENKQTADDAHEDGDAGSSTVSTSHNVEPTTEIIHADGDAGDSADSTAPNAQRKRKRANIGLGASQPTDDYGDTDNTSLSANRRRKLPMRECRRESGAVGDISGLNDGGGALQNVTDPTIADIDMPRPSYSPMSSADELPELDDLLSSTHVPSSVRAPPPTTPTSHATLSLSAAATESQQLGPPSNPRQPETPSLNRHIINSPAHEPVQGYTVFSKNVREECGRRRSALSVQKMKIADRNSETNRLVKEVERLERETRELKQEIITRDVETGRLLKESADTEAGVRRMEELDDTLRRTMGDLRTRL